MHIAPKEIVAGRFGAYGISARVSERPPGPASKTELRRSITAGLQRLASSKSKICPLVNEFISGPSYHLNGIYK